MECKYCGKECQKAGRQKTGTQKYYCSSCKKYQQKEYRYIACRPGVTALIPKLVCNSFGIRGIARVLQIAVNTAVKQILCIAEMYYKAADTYEPQVF
ncbi:MAG: hypothetical protein JNM88_12535 [Chitinophagaceae bacterium]|nr:hypothetical protein [Chitinophagaceae bacterium]